MYLMYIKAIKRGTKNEKKKDSVNVSMRLDREIWEQLKTYADKKGQTYTVATERILKKFLEENDGVDKKGE